MALHPGERRGAKGTDLGGQFIGPKSIAKFLVKLLKPEHEHKPGEPEPDIRRSMGRFTTAGGSVISAHLPSRKPRPDDRVVDTRDERRLGTVATVDHAAGTMRVHWDDGTHEVRPQQSVTPPIHDPARSFDAHPLATSPAARKMAAAAPKAPVDRYRQHLADEVAAGRVDSHTAASAMRAAQGDHIAAAQSHVDALQAPAGPADPWQQNVDGVNALLAGVSSADLSRIARDAGIQLGRDQSVDDRRDTIARHMASFGSSDDAPGEIRDAMERLSIAPKKAAPRTASTPRSERTDNERFGGVGKKALPPSKSASPRAEAVATDPALTNAEKRSRLKAMGMTPEQVDSLVPTGAKKAAKASPAAAKMARGKAAVPVSITAGELSAMTSREQGHAAVASLSKTELVAMARELHIARPTTMKADDLRREIVDATIGRQLDSIATRGFRGDIHSPEPPAVGLAATPGHSPSAPSHSPAVAKMTRAKAAPKAAKAVVHTPTRAQLNALPSREAGHEALQGLSKAQLVSMGQELSIPGAKGMSAVKLRAAIVEATTGYTLDSQAIRSLQSVRY